MDYAMTRKLMEQGRMPNFTRLSRGGGFQALGTSVPPLSPVAWSDFITGLDSGGHGIFDFLHRNPHHIVPTFSMSRSEDPQRFLSLGTWRFPLESGGAVNLRKGGVFWKALKDNQVHTAIVRMPANYPPVGVADQELSGMGTPDLHGTYGIFTFITTRFGAGDRRVAGGEIQEVLEQDGVIRAVLKGPNNPLRSEPAAEPLRLPLVISRNRERNGISLIIDDRKIVLHQGEWTSWIPVEFELLPAGLMNLNGMVRLYLRSAFPELELYISPVNFDPMNPDAPLSWPADFAGELAGVTGRFYTQGMPEDTKALEEGILTREEFFQQARLAADDIMAQLDTMTDSFLGYRRSFIFYYLGHIDQISHMMWKSTDPTHPAYDTQTDPLWAEKLEGLYTEIDGLVGRLAGKIGVQGELFVMSDHGFAPWRREMDLNGWLRDKGYLILKPGRRESREFFSEVDWTRTRAYGVGFNGLYLNLRGREKQGIVPEAEKDRLLVEIRHALLSAIDPGNGRPAVTKVYLAEEHYKDRGALEGGPDMVVGYAYGTRVSSSSALGAVAGSNEVFSDHLAPWSGDHAMDHETVKGILLTSRPIPRPVADLRDLSEMIVGEFRPEPDITPAR